MGDDLGDREERKPARRGTRRRRPRSPRCRRTGTCRRPRPRRVQARAWERVGVGRLELERQRREVERGQRGRRTLRIGERVRDRHAHVGIAEMRERRAVAEAHERVDDRRRLQHDLDSLVGDVEEEVRLDQLEPLVGERRGVDGDLRPHPPGRMCERLLGRDIAELVARQTAERTARAGEHEARHLCGGGVRKTLVQRRVLRVDREDPAAAALLRCARELTGGDEALLVGERKVDSRLERPERRVHAGEADDGVEDDVRLRTLEQLRRVAADLLERRRQHRRAAWSRR